MYKYINTFTCMSVPSIERKKLRRQPEDAERVKNTKILL
jgi:hypothetical protein